MNAETAGLAGRFREKVVFELGKRLNRDAVSGERIQPRPGLVKIGSRYGGWVVPADLLDQSSICYCAGVGEDISFDLGLIERFGCTVFAFDPTPRAIAHVAKTAADNPLYRFFPVGLWDMEEILRFYAPRDPSHVSHSVLNLQKTGDFFEAPCKPLRQLLEENGHERIDLLKLDVEGAEYRIVRSIVDHGITVRVLCIEYDECFNPLDGGYKARVAESIKALRDYGFDLVNLDSRGNYTFVHR